MNQKGGWFRQLGARMRAGVQRFMVGRYGTDKLNIAILTVGVVVCFLGMFPLFAFIRLVFSTASWVLMFWAIFRMLSRNTYKRYRENRKYLQLMEQLKDRQHRYFTCPRCRQPVRVPRGKGKIAITCPKCKEKFIKKT